MNHVGITESIVRERDKRDPDTISVYECGSVAFLASLSNLPNWKLAGVPISGDKTATYPWRVAQ